MFHCRSTSASTASCTFRRMCCPTHCASYCASCQPLLRAFFGWIRYPPPATRRYAAPPVTRSSSRVSLARNFERYVTKFAPHKVLKLISCGKSIIDGRVVLPRVDSANGSRPATLNLRHLILNQTLDLKAFFTKFGGAYHERFSTGCGAHTQFLALQFGWAHTLPVAICWDS